MGISDFDFYAGFSPERFAMKLGIDPWSADGYSKIFWYRAEDINVAHGANFEYWPEAIRGSSNQSLLLRQANSSLQFKYFDGYGPNGYPVARFTTGSFMIASNPLIASNNPRAMPFSCYVVLIRRSAVAANPTLFALVDIAAGTNSRMGLSMDNSSQSRFQYPSSGIAGVGALSQDAFTILSGIQTTSQAINAYSLRNNTVLSTSATEPSNTNYTNYKVVLNTTSGAAATSSIVESTQWDLLESIYIQKDMTREEHSEVANMLAQKYSITLESAPTLKSRFYYPDTQDAGRPEVHESLSSPLPVDPDGYFARSFELPTNSTSGIVTTTRHLLNDGYYIGLDNTTAISLRAWVRVGGIVANGQSQIVLFSHMDEPWKSFDKDAFVAYGLKFGTIENDGYASLGLRIASRDVDGYVVPGYEDVVCTGTYHPDVWYRIRLDVIPIGAAEDRLNAYVGSGLTDAETWTPVGDLTIPSGSDAYREKLWKNRIGFYVATQNEGTSPDSTKYYIDRFQVRTRDV